MPSQRFLLVEGVPGIGVCHPDARPVHGSHARYVGHELDDCVHEDGKGCTKHPDPDHVLEHYRARVEVVRDAPELRVAIKQGELKLHRECVAKNFDEARKKLEPPKAEPKTDAATAEATKTAPPPAPTPKPGA